MRIDLSSLSQGRSVVYHVSVEEDVVAELMGCSPTEPLNMRIEGTWVDEVLYLRITTSGKAYSRCDLCGEPCLADVGCQVDEELTYDSPYYDGEAQCFVLDDLEREAVVLSAPSRALCRVDCKGVCPICGQNRNLKSCDCKPNNDIGDNSPFGVLQQLISTGGANNGSTKM